MFFAPFVDSLAPTAGRIVVLIAGFFNCHRLDVGICPRVQLKPVKGNPLFSNGEFPDVRTDSVFEFGAAHAEICRGIHRPDEAWWGLEDHRRFCVGHRESSPCPCGLV
ncbi:hypothetical protein D3C87_1794540 [compost metagenome]